ncbi:MAG: hemerythrin family protein [Kiritimatiellaeota bacterium]|nr:hemerythrin family protein [Kiritimatiellota bacterium]
MDEILWDESLSVGVRRIDEQHKALIRRLNAMARAVAQHEGEREILRTLGFLLDYTNFHFTDEEDLMASVQYPGLADQKAAHEDFKHMLRRMEEDLQEEGATKALADSINNFLLLWLTRHIRKLDAPLGDFLAEKSKNA